MKAKWISVKDRLPSEKMQVVLVIHWNISQKSNKKMIPLIDTAYWMGDKFKHSVYITTLLGIMTVDLKDVTHWMPLPPPPTK